MKIQNFISTSLVLFGLLFYHAQAMDEISSNDINSLPEETLIRSFQNLSMCDLGHCALVCEQWNKVSSDNIIWEEKAKSYGASGHKFSSKYNCSFDNVSWKDILKESCLFWDNFTPEHPVIQSLLGYDQYSPFPTFERVKEKRNTKCLFSRLNYELLREDGKEIVKQILERSRNIKKEQNLINIETDLNN